MKAYIKILFLYNRTSFHILLLKFTTNTLELRKNHRDRVRTTLLQYFHNTQSIAREKIRPTKLTDETFDDIHSNSRFTNSQIQVNHIILCTQ